ncbi:hypothetical protein WBU96_06770 [Bacillus albus]|nr:hypothetical protein [Bacillus cereus group sp. Bc177]MDA2320301.1 hypothetical protein [Bacillus cereus group sp. Bc177]
MYVVQVTMPICSSIIVNTWGISATGKVQTCSNINIVDPIDPG